VTPLWIWEVLFRLAFPQKSETAIYFGFAAGCEAWLCLAGNDLLYSMGSALGSALA
jgi:hypothetical protein